jgi:hypothetical protein
LSWSACKRRGAGGGHHANFSSLCYLTLKNDSKCIFRHQTCAVDAPQFSYKRIRWLPMASLYKRSLIHIVNISLHLMTPKLLCAYKLSHDHRERLKGAIQKSGMVIAHNEEAKRKVASDITADRSSVSTWLSLLRMSVRNRRDGDSISDMHQNDAVSVCYMIRDRCVMW